MSARNTEQTFQTEGPLGELLAAADGMESFEEAAPTQEKRKGSRRRFAIPVWVRINCAGGAKPPEARQLLNISANGIGFFSKARFSPDQRVMVELCINNTIWSGPMRVVHCTDHAGGYKVGMTVLDDPRSSASLPEESSVQRFSTASNLTQLQAEIPKAMQAYRQARKTWGLLGTSLQNRIKQVIGELAPPENGLNDNCQRENRRVEMEGDVRLIIPDHCGAKWLRATILDISEGGAGLLLPFGLTVDYAERELAGEFRISPGMAVVVGIGREPNTLWLPAEISHVSGPKDGAMHIGVQFNTPKSQKAFGA